MINSAKIVNLDKQLLGPRFETQTPESFRAHVEGLKQIRALGKAKPTKTPRVKKAVALHEPDATTGICSLCQKKPRNPKAKCGPGTLALNATEVAEEAGPEASDEIENNSENVVDQETEAS